MRRPLIIGNWKLHGNTNMVNNLIIDILKKINNIKNCDIAIAPPAIYLSQAKNILNNSCIFLAAQNVDINSNGAFTGEISARMLKDIGVKYIIIGHSERRYFHKESDEFIIKKFAAVLEQDLIPVLCIGETEFENKSGKTKDICSRQIDAIINSLGVDVFQNSVIAYEPIWAINTNKSANPTQIQLIHNFIRSYISKKNNFISEQVIIQYGGSVDDKNALELFNQKDIDGVLVGRASLKADIFVKIIKIAIAAKLNN
ncbi:Triosephosphate isomerase [Candidatus Providencia siddallii]|uniref:Triosephosphate isomerase n=1 Tax=Candidatus Providencia siddallii TaxID=1715285 RepID=A0A0M6W6L3_9GAMM|nr:Triosephosphate isomerase [Candidatus Providencia siddallii]